MDLQAWDNIISIASNAVTALSVVGGVIFGGVKLQEIVKTRKMEQAFASAIALKDEIDATRGRYNRMRFDLTRIMTFIDTLAKTGQKVNLHNQKLLSTFDEAISKLDGFDGIGIKLVDGLLEIDLDNCISSGVIDERAKEIIKQFPNAYIEYSPNANGFHILMKYTGIYDKKNYYIKHDGIEFTVHYLQPNI